MPDPTETSSESWAVNEWNWCDELSGAAPEVIGLAHREHGTTSPNNWKADDWNLRGGFSSAADDGDW